MKKARRKRDRTGEIRDKRTGRIGHTNFPKVLQWIAEGMTAPQIADLLGVNQETVRKYARRRGIQIRPGIRQGSNHPSWKDGTTLDRTGYLLRRVAKDGPHGYLIRAIQKRESGTVDTHGYAPVHRIVMHDLLGRRLLRGEVVDHIDGDKRNNDPSNLRLFSSNAEHLRETLKGRVPKWTPEGWNRMQEAVRAHGRRRRKVQPSESQP